MENYTTTNNHRRYKAHISIFGTTQLHLRNPYIIAWWSAAFPGFGHLILSKYLRGVLLFIWEIFINHQMKLNQAMVYSFTGQIDLVKEVLDTRWMLLYIPVYFFAIWDSYRTTVDLNKIYLLAEREDAPYNTFSIGAMEINYLDKRNPIMAIVWSMMIPSTGHLYIHRIVIAAMTLSITVVFVYYSHMLEGIHHLFFGEIKKSTEILDAQWLLYYPSFYFFAIYDSYVNTVENNKLFEKEQKNFLRKNYQSSSFKVKKGTKVS
ncbi:hypothetical protein JOC86_000090 [Bacillus pakistanensis]|uniref:Uncharacterized protein n=1 Tax=Rossellomorea pakistanensis TaxID=992288 RepID=A0ABS2N6S9_9BACI|nr:hypothetical protein [Bacillus pakistanensis]MBM7583553.1 hypothetical protein [Bacillus pakistanensis]